MTSQNQARETSRREFLKSTGRLAAVSAVTAGFVPRAFAGEDNTIDRKSVV